MDVMQQKFEIQVRTGKKNDKGQHIAALVQAGRPMDWHPDFLRWVIHAGLRAIGSEKANTVPTEGGQKLEYVRALLAEAAEGKMPRGMVYTPSAPSADPLADLIAKAVRDWISARIAKALAAGADKFVKPTGANGRTKQADEFRAVASLSSEAREMIEATFDFAREAWHPAGKLVAFADAADRDLGTTFRADAEREQADRAKLAQDKDLKTALATLFAKG